jgi:hypothetical protein
MSPLQSELNRLYSASEPADGRVRVMVLELARPTEWNTLRAVWRGVQTDLALPEPAIAVSGIDGHQLWFSLAEPVCAADARAFLEALRVRYLGAVEPRRIGMLLGFEAQMVPALQAENGRWSAFVSADLAAIFTDEPWLDLEPNPDAQARLLSRLECVKPGAFQAILNQIKPATKAASTAPAEAPPTLPAAPEPVAAHANCLEAKRFLTDVMNDPAVDLHLRIEAAKALLPYA